MEFKGAMQNKGHLPFPRNLKKRMSVNTTMRSETAKCTQANTKKQCSAKSTHPDHSSNLVRLRRIQGQLAGIERMISAQRYCVDILVQLRAATSALSAIEDAVFEKHLRSCVQNALHAKNNKAIDAKIDEVMNLISRRK